MVLGIVQGATEFLPVSSDGHLIIAREAFGFTDRGLAFDVVLHAGTLLAVVLFFRPELRRYAYAGMAALRERSVGEDPDRKMGLLLVVATFPAVVAGAALEGAVAGPLREPLYAGLFLLATAALLVIAENAPQRDKGDIRQWSYRHALFIGGLQATAILPGLSRSGAAFTGGRMLGLTRPEAVRFSFLMAVPVIAGAIVYEAIKLMVENESDFGYEYVVGAIFAFVTGFLCVKFLLAFVRRFNLLPFALYCVVVGAVTVALSV
ncbi:MAG: undecaprenyl-diphosphate phosphatase [Dehalococcoidia bacterium]